jgi:hypothetical protein
VAICLIATVSGIQANDPGTCPVSLTVLPGEFVSVTALPSGDYTYMWNYPGAYPGTSNGPTEITNPSQDETSGTGKATLNFNAPITPGTYTWTAYVTSTHASLCVDSCTVTLTVVPPPTCPTDSNVCVDNLPADPATPPRYTYMGHLDSSLIYTWYINSVDSTGQALQLSGVGPWGTDTQPTFRLSWTDSRLNKPTAAGTSLDNIMTFKVTDTHGDTLKTCSWHIYTYKMPDATISHTP